MIRMRNGARVALVRGKKGCESSVGVSRSHARACNSGQCEWRAKNDCGHACVQVCIVCAMRRQRNIAVSCSNHAGSKNLLVPINAPL